MLGVLMQGANYGDDGYIAETHHPAILYIALSNPKTWIVSMHPMHQLIFEPHRDQSLQPSEQSVY
jgi:hypothetical protein